MRLMSTQEETVASEVSDQVKTRIITGVVGIPLTLAALFASVYYPLILTLVILFLCLTGIHEALKTAGADKVKAIYVPCFVYGTVVLFVPYIKDQNKMLGVIMAASMLFLFVMFGILLKKHLVLRIEAVCTAMILTMFVALPFMVVEFISRSGKNALGGIFLVLFCLGIAWYADAGAYFIGRVFGKHKMAPVLSPKKTIEGAVGGFVISMIISLGSAYIYADVLRYRPGGINYLNMAVITAVCILMSMFGDISFSTVKRQYGIKDFGTLLPGHGGVLDRFDSVLFVCPSFYMLNFILPILK